MAEEKGKWTDQFGNEYDTYENYYNSEWLDDDIIYNYLAQGKRTPQNEKEIRWQKEGKRLLKKGGYDISFN